MTESNGAVRGPKSRVFGLDFLRSIEHEPLAFMERLARDYGDYVEFRIGPSRLFLLNHPDAIRAVLTSHYSAFLKGRGVERSYGFLGEGLLSSEGEKHKNQRRSTQPAFRHERLVDFTDAMAESADQVIGAWSDGATINVLEELRKITLSVLGRTLFQNDFNSEHTAIVNALQSAMEKFRSFSVPMPPLIERLRAFSNRQARRSKKQILIPIRRALERSNLHDRNDVLAQLMQDEHGIRSDIDQILDEALTIFVAGYETTAIAVTWALDQVARHPEVAEQLESEADSVLRGQRPTHQNIQRLRYTRMVFEEAMRLYPPVWRLMRRATRDFDVDGIVIPAGSYVILSQWLMHHDARFFPNPERFDPQRWTPECRAERPVFSYFPFGGAPRRCIGEAFGLQESVVILAVMAQHCRLVPTSSEPPGLRPLHMLQPDGPVIAQVQARVPAYATSVAR